MRQQCIRYFFPLFAATYLFALLPASGQTRVNSPALKYYTDSEFHVLVRPINEAERTWHDFTLIREANAGDPLAQHELGLKYFLGTGFVADTGKAALWIGRAAKQDLIPARFNLGVFQMNGWGTPWNPFEAYRNFRFAASQAMPDAEYAVGLMYLDNLVVPRNEAEAFCWLGLAADSGYAAAAEALAQLNKRTGAKSGQSGSPDAEHITSAQSPFGLIFLDFSSDSSEHTNDTILREEALRWIGAHGGDSSFSAPGKETPVTRDETHFGELKEMAAAGNPEALTLLGRYAELGIHGRSDRVRCAAYYLDAIRNESVRAPDLLWELSKDRNFIADLTSRIDRGDGEALFVWSGLFLLGFNHQITPEQAITFLEKAAAGGNLSALLELGMCYANGRLVAKDKVRANRLWGEARTRGSLEGAIRLNVSSIMSGGDSRTTTADLPLLTEGAERGSLLAEVAVGYATERGISGEANPASAARQYRDAARRGSRIGFEALKRLYDNLRPPEMEFSVSP